MHRFLFAVVLAALVVPSAPGGSAKLTTTWKDPNVTKVTFSKIVVAFLSGDAELRRRIEGGLARRISRSVAANTVVPDEVLTDRAAVKSRLASIGIDGAIVIRVVDVQREKVVSQGESWYVGVPNFWDMWEPTWLTVNTATHVYEERLVTADIMLYSVATAKPVWIGRLTGKDPKNLRELLDDLVKAGASELKKQKLI
ncbi:MAG TPA: hypothetical protein VFV34_03350 [Blastocatellia bacterium]|nr:hypothetical protein [Blastocatellia bacterium]